MVNGLLSVWAWQLRMLGHALEIGPQLVRLCIPQPMRLQAPLPVPVRPTALPAVRAKGCVGPADLRS